MAISNETMKAVVRDYRGIELSDEELELVRPEVESYMEAMAGIEELDLANLMSGRPQHVGTYPIKDSWHTCSAQPVRLRAA